MADIYEDELIKLTKVGTQIFKLNKGIITEDDSFDIVNIAIVSYIPLPRIKNIVEYLKLLMKEYKESVVDISKEIPLNIKERDERYFALYVLGKNFKDLFRKMSEKVQERYIVDTGKGLGIFDEKINNILYHITVLIREGVDKDLFPSDIIQKITDSDFNDKEKDYMILLYGML